MIMEQLVVEDRKNRMADLEKFLREKYNSEYENGVQLVVKVTTREGDEPAIQKLVSKFEAEGIKMSYGCDNESEHILIWARQPKKKA